jgi:hypothetical protein
MCFSFQRTHSWSTPTTCMSRLFLFHFCHLTYVIRRTYCNNVFPGHRSYSCVLSEYTPYGLTNNKAPQKNLGEKNPGWKIQQKNWRKFTLRGVTGDSFTANCLMIRQSDGFLRSFSLRHKGVLSVQFFWLRFLQLNYNRSAWL